mmetsp:Transcript_59403/g.139082  ORF Transcript_59403/g.139082 Transcript_59403/m.139082 type:complete len:163 (+) Transcript_59403:39-527(+)
MGCSQSAMSEEPRKAAVTAHAFPIKEVGDMYAKGKKPKARDDKVRLGKTQVSLEELQPTVLRIGDVREAECEEPEVSHNYDSWTHSVDGYDVALMKQGHSVPVNGQADVEKSNAMQQFLEDLANNPDRLMSTVEAHRAHLEEQQQERKKPKSKPVKPIIVST